MEFACDDLKQRAIDLHK